MSGDLKISQLPVYIIPIATDIFAIVDVTTGITKKIRLTDLAAFFAGGATAWGTITGTLASQTDLQAALDAKQKKITVASSAPVGPSLNDLWVDTT